MLKSVVISGEASETDSDNESTASTNQSKVKVVNYVQGAVVTGEDSESDEEIDHTSSSLFDFNAAVHAQVLAERKDSLLHTKLRECNGHLQENLENLCENVINEAGKSLRVLDQQLLKSQIVLQNAVSSLKTFNSTSLVLKTTFQCLLADRFMSNISVKEI